MDRALLLHSADEDLKDVIPLAEITAAKKLAGADSVRRNSGLFSFENILLADKLRCLELATTSWSRKLRTQKLKVSISHTT